MRISKSLLTLWLIAPIAAVAVLSVWIVLSMRGEPWMNAPPVGAGAAQTGGANALGEWLAHRNEASQIRVVVEDRSEDSSGGLRLFLAHRANDWKGEPMTATTPGRWEWTGSSADLDEGFEVIRTGEDGVTLRDAEGRRRLHLTSGEQVVVVGRFVP
ncbi:MAG: hypothetical protein DYG94_13545 [Leptolyngbya sp. PLA3]|nr:MAG: hypothetical protein EDM82_14100 [Cyanobacteria bacterium CYA]MCE7969750.1 hypothetical protein [Leptolyngbya sp. PL-A3]